MMIRILVVDDEPRHRQSMVSLLQSLNPENRLFEARDGRRALELMATVELDVVITDIRMPHMDGLQMLREIRKAGYPVKTVILSVYDQFEFARQALETGAFGYLLKPVDPREVEQLLARLEQAIAQEREQSQSRTRIEHRLSKIMPLYTNHMLNRLIAQSESEQDRKELLELYRLDGQGYLMLTYFSESRQLPDAAQQREISENISYWIQDRLADENPIIFMVDQYPGQIAVLVNSDRMCDRATLRQLQQQMLREYAIHVRVALSAVFENLFQHAGQAYEQAFLALQFSFYDILEPVYYRQLNYDPLHVIVHRYDQEERLSAALLKSDEAGVKCTLDLLLADMLEPNRPLPEGLKQRVVHLVVEQIHRFRNSLPEQSVRAIAADAQRISECEDYDTMARLVYGAFTAMARQMAEQKNHAHVHIVNQTIKMIRENHHQTNMSLETVAAQFHYNPSYFSTLFKSISGETFSEHLTKVRMAEARRLLQESNKPVADIATLCGYRDGSYFARVFKQQTGASPEEYRKRMGLRRPFPEGGA